MFKISEIPKALNFLRAQKNLSISIAVTGGGSAIAPMLLDGGGMSGVVNDIVIPYSQESLERFIGQSVEKFCSQEVATLMAAKVGQHSRSRHISIGLTCSLRKREGEREGRLNHGYITVISCVDEIGTIRTENEEFSFQEIKQGDVAKNVFPLLNVGDQENRGFQETIVSIFILTKILDALNYKA